MCLSSCGPIYTSIKRCIVLGLHTYIHSHTTLKHSPMLCSIETVHIQTSFATFLLKGSTQHQLLTLLCILRGSTTDTVITCYKSNRPTLYSMIQFIRYKYLSYGCDGKLLVCCSWVHHCCSADGALFSVCALLSVCTFYLFHFVQLLLVLLNCSHCLHNSTSFDPYYISNLFQSSTNITVP